jgi:hydrogenase expression/formation protein HypC
MCLAVPGRVVELFTEAETPMGILDFGGITKKICLAYVPEARVGDYAIVHVGFAISLIDEASAQESLRLFREMGVLEEELGLASDEQYAAPHESDACPVPPRGA